jgi:beta-lactamase regulating signal transducer with metallopeptidase domain
VNPLLRWLTSPEWAHVVGALLHSLWLGAIVALALAVLMRRLTNPLTRYRCALSALGVIGIAGLVTWAVLNAPNSAPHPITAKAIEPTAPTITADVFDSNPTDKVVVIGQMTRPEAPTNWTAWLALTWMAGAMVMLLRAGVKVAGAEKLRRSCQPLADEPIAALVAEACRAVGLACKIRVAVTDKLTSPAVVGVLVPTLILPLSLFTTLTPTQIQFVLLHELAHIRRGDYLTNLFQLFAEALLFFNPAVWWISHQVRREREACCDALAIELSGAPADYARTLVRVAENILQPAPAAAPAFGDDGREPSSLADRVQRLVIPGYRPALRLTWRAMLTSLLVGMALLVLSAIGTRNTVGAILTSNKQSHVSAITNQTTVLGERPLDGDSEINKTDRLETDSSDPVAAEISGGSFFYNSQTAISIVTNGGRVKFLGQELSADVLHIDNKASMVIASGNARLETTNGTYSGSKLTVDLKSNAPVGSDFIFVPRSQSVTGTTQATTSTTPSPNSKPATTLSKIHQIRLEKVYFNRQSLREVVRELSEKTKASDPANEGVEFALDPDHQAVDPATGLPQASISEELGSVLVTSRYRISGPLITILDRIVSFADKPIKYAFTNSIVRFSMRGANESEPLFTREFDLPARTIYGKILTNLTQAETNRTASSNLSPKALQGLRTWLSGIGVNMDLKQGRSLFYIDQRGILLARATLAELDAIETAIVNLNHSATTLDNYTFQLETTIARAIETSVPDREARYADEKARLEQQWFWHRGNETASASKVGTTKNPTEPLFTRTFNLPPEVLYGTIITNLVPSALSGSATGVKGEDVQTASAGFRTWFRRLGIDLDPQLGKSVFYSNRGGLFVRATKTELDTIEDAVMKLNASSIELTTRTYQVETTTIAKAIEAAVPEFKSGATTNITAGLRALFLSAGVDLTLPKSIFYNDRAGGLFVRATKKDLDTIESLLRVIGQQPAQVNIKTVFVELPFGKDQPKALAKILEPITPENGATFTGILTAAQFKLILRTLETNSAAKILASPQITTTSGQQAQIQIADVKTIISGMTAVVTNGMTNLVYQSEAMSFGPVLDILPTVSNDGYTVHMTLSPTFTEFLGYEDAKKLKLSPPDDKATLPLPILRKRQMTTSASVWDGQTIVLGNFSDQMLDTPPDLKGTPKTSGKKQSKQLLVFVTPTIIDPAGNPANKDMGIPSSLNSFGTDPVPKAR